MDNLYVLRGKMQEIYGRHSRIFDKVFQFILALVVFYLINGNIGFMKVLAQPAATLALAVICTFFPLLITVLAAAVLVLGHMYAASLGMLLVTAMIFFVMFVFYFRLTPKKALVVLLTPVAFMFKVPYIIPIAYALISGPSTIIAVIMGTVTYYMMQYIKKAAPTLQGEEAADMMTQISAYVKQLFLNKQMWIVIIAFIICFLLVYTLRRQAMDHAWKIAIAAGAVVNIVVIAGGNIVLGEQAAYGSLIIGSILAVVVGLILEFFFFSVDYMKSENLQFEDDDYYYYVKAVPKLAVSGQEKTVKKINNYQEMDDEEFKTEEIRKPVKSKKTASKKTTMKKRPQPTKGPVTKRQDIDDVDKVLLAESLKRELKKND